jgi:hypothetical protein
MTKGFGKRTIGLIGKGPVIALVILSPVRASRESPGGL